MKSCLGSPPLAVLDKRISITVYKAQYDRNNERIKKNKWHKKKRMSTVEPAFGTMINFLGMSKVNTQGINQANKCKLLLAVAYNLKKTLKIHQAQEDTTAQSSNFSPI